MRLCDDPDVKDVIRFLREREVVHFQRFGEVICKCKEQMNQANIYLYNPAFDTGFMPEVKPEQPEPETEPEVEPETEPETQPETEPETEPDVDVDVDVDVEVSPEGEPEVDVEVRVNDNILSRFPQAPIYG